MSKPAESVESEVISIPLKTVMSGRRVKRGTRDRGSRSHSNELGLSKDRQALLSHNPEDEPQIRISMRGSRGRGGYRGMRGGRRRRGGADFGRGKLEDDFVDAIEEEDFVEEHVVLRAPPSLADEIREMTRDKEQIQDISLTFTDPRTGTFKLKEREVGMKLVDLPTIIESQKIFINKSMIKVADVSQMLVLDDPQNQPSRPFKSHDTVAWPDGLTPPLKDVRRRRFRKRISKQIIEIVENELERLLLKDLQAIDVKYEIADAPDREEYDSDNELEPATQDPTAEELESQATPKAGEELITEADLVVSSENEGLDLDELERAVELRELGDPNEVDEEGLDEEDSEDSESEIDEEALEQKAVLKETIVELESNLEKKRADLAVATNPIIKKRFEDIIAKLKLELDIKIAQLETFDQ